MILNLSSIPVRYFTGSLSSFVDSYYFSVVSLWAVRSSSIFRSVQCCFRLKIISALKMATETDNLDARMEAIRLKNEELEKKHREIQEDEQNAKLMDAVVDVRYTEIPKVHPYDNIDLDFDVKDADKELVKNPDYKPKSESFEDVMYLHLQNFFFTVFSSFPRIDERKADRRPLPRKELLDEIPPDPVNFLREDGGDEKARAEPNQNQRPSNSKNRTHNRNRQDRPRPERSNNDDAEGSLGESPPRPRNQNQRPRQQPPHQQQQQQQNRSPQEGSAPRRPIHPQQLRSERRSAPAPPSDEPMGHSQQHTPNRTRRQNYRQPNKESDRNNITVEITDGEVRSVKCMCWRCTQTDRHT